MNVLITGGYGFIGSHVGERFYKEGCKVYIIDNLSTGSPTNVTFPHKFYELDVQDQQCEEVFRCGKFDVVVHLAAQTNVSNSYAHPQKDTDVNLVGLVNMLQLAHKYGVGKFIYVSSMQVYDGNEQGVVTEETECLPASPYGLNKLLGEKYCAYWLEQYGLQTVSLRLSYVYGPRQTRTCESGFVLQTMEKFFLAQEEKVDWEEKPIDLLYVLDVADAIFRVAISDKTGVYNLCSSQQTLMAQLRDILARLEEGSEQLSSNTGSAHSAKTFYDHSKARKEFDWVPLYSLEEGLALTYEWFKECMHANRIKRRKWQFPLLKKVHPYLENGLFFCIVAVLTLQHIPLLENLLMDYSMIYIFTIGMIYGLRHSMIAVCLSSLLELLSKLMVGRELLSLFYDAQYLFTITIYVGIGMVVGYITDSRKQHNRWLEQQLDELMKRYHFLLDVYKDTCAIKEELQEQLLQNRNGIAAVYKEIVNLDRSEPEEIISESMNVLEELLEDGKFSYYTVAKDGKIHRIIHSTQNYSDGLSCLEVEEEFKQQLVENNFYVNRHLHPCLPMMAAPLFYHDRMIGIITIDELDFDKMSYSTENRFRVCVDLVSRFLTKAMDFITLTADKRYIDGTSILNQAAFAIVLECKRRANQNGQLHYQLLELKSQNLSPQRVEAIFRRYLRECDYIGLVDQSYGILLTNPDAPLTTQICQVLKKLDELDAESLNELTEEKLLYA